MELGKEIPLSWTLTDECQLSWGRGGADVAERGRKDKGVLGQGNSVKNLTFLGNAKQFCASGPTIMDWSDASEQHVGMNQGVLTSFCGKWGGVTESVQGGESHSQIDQVS